MDNSDKKNTQERLNHLELMKSRRSHRSFLDMSIDDKLLRSLLEVGISSASGGNLQMFSIIVVKERDRCEELGRICGAQPFIRKAAVNLVYVIDMHKMEIYARRKKAPFTANRSLMHFLVSMQDIICSAQSVETAACLSGLGCCYAGSPLVNGPELVNVLKLPPLTFPVVILSIGYPKDRCTPRPAKLAYDSMVFEDTYKEMSDDEINAFFENKYAGMKTALPASREDRAAMLDDFMRALETTYSREEAEAIVAESEERGFIWENQRRFGIHYHALDLYRQGLEIYENMKSQSIEPFNILAKKS